MKVEEVRASLSECSGPVALDSNRETYNSVIALQDAGEARFMGRLRDWHGEYVVMAMQVNKERG